MPDLIFTRPLAPILADFAHETPQLEIACLDQGTLTVDPLDEVFQREIGSTQICPAETSLLITRPIISTRCRVAHLGIHLLFRFVKPHLLHHGVSVVLQGVKHGVELALGIILRRFLVFLHLLAHILGVLCHSWRASHTACNGALRQITLHGGGCKGQSGGRQGASSFER